MAVRRLQYARELEEGLAKTGSLEKSYKKAVKKSEVGAIATAKKKLKKLFGKKKVVKPTASEKQVIKKRLKKKYPQMSQAGWGKPKKVTKRTKQISKGLKQAGLSEKEIAKFRKK